MSELLSKSKLQYHLAEKIHSKDFILLDIGDLVTFCRYTTIIDSDQVMYSEDSAIVLEVTKNAIKLDIGLEFPIVRLFTHSGECTQESDVTKTKIVSFLKADITDKVQNYQWSAK